MVQTRSQLYKKTSNKNQKQGVYKNTSKSQKDICNITHIRENNRIITIAFLYNVDNNSIRYGATIYKKENNSSWNKKNHTNTAKSRFNTRPIELNNFEPKKGHFRELLRKQLFIFGVQGERYENSSC